MENNFDVVESATLTEQPTGKRWRALLIKAGWGSKGYYTEEALKRDGPTVFKAGTPIFLDHQTPEERESKPFGSVTTFAGELATDAVWDAEEGGLVSEVEFFDHQQPLVRSLAKRIGLSIRARTIAERGTIEGRSGRIVTGLVGAKSVDLVVRAGAGGQLLDVLESETDTEMEEQQMETEALELLKKLSADQDAKFAAMEKRFTDLEESLAAAAPEEVVEEAPVKDATAEPTIDIQQTVVELVAAEIAKIKAAQVQEESAVDGTEENVDLEESATELRLPKIWAVKENK